MSPIQYALFENNLTSDPNDYSAQVNAVASADLDAIVRRMIDQGSTTTEADIFAVLEDAIKACESLLIDGQRVNLGGLVELFPRIKGVFNGLSDGFDPARHRIDVGANPGARVRKTVRDSAAVQKIESIKPAPNPVEYVDLGSGEANGTVTPGNIGTLNGHRLKFDPTQTDEGIFFVVVSHSSEVKVTNVQKNKPSQLVFLIPSTITADDYYLEVRARMQGGDELRTGRLDAILTA
ncbi:DUF4469 domain-containing protein [Candidatus Sumerlaeota bacterium]|nr:DUF4469 domain-containing protein [Candidatus Sumerlaeota bacterium]